MHSHKFLDALTHDGHKVVPKVGLELSIRRLIDEAGGWIDFSKFMAMALFDPTRGYYSSQENQIGLYSSSDFVTSPELTPAFGKALSHSVLEALDKTQTDEVWEFGPGTGELAAQLLECLGERIKSYTLVELSGGLGARQRARLEPYKNKVRWIDALPQNLRGVVIGNEVLDAQPVHLIKQRGGVWYEQGVVWNESLGEEGGFDWATRTTSLRPPVELSLELASGGDYLTELHLQSQAFIQTLVKHFERGVFFFIDYGFPEREYYHPERHMGTLMCHHRHRADENPLVLVGEKDITAHVNFTGVALAAQEAGAQVLGYTSQANFLINSGMLKYLENVDINERGRALKLIHEHEMGELFKVLIFEVGGGEFWEPLGTSKGDRTHTL